jgi:hypothetical protein
MNIAKIFNRELHNSYIDMKIVNFDIYNLKQRFEDILEIALNKALNAETDIYKILIKKYKKLNI